jgi:hypothetical protein
MTYKPEGFRSLPALMTKLRADQGITLILVKADGSARYGHGRVDKDAIVQSFNELEDMLLLAWTGQYKTDVFVLTRSDLDAHYV